MHAQRSGQSDALLLTSRELVRVTAGQAGQSDKVEQFTGPLPTPGWGHPPDFEAESHVFQGVHIGEEAVGLEDHPQVATMGWDVGDVVTPHQHTARVELL